MKNQRKNKIEDNINPEEDLEFQPSLLGRLIDAIIFDNTGLPTDLVLEMREVERPLLKVLAGKVSDPIEAQKIEERYQSFARKLEKYLERKYLSKNDT